MSVSAYSGTAVKGIDCAKMAYRNHAKWRKDAFFCRKVLHSKSVDVRLYVVEGGVLVHSTGAVGKISRKSLVYRALASLSAVSGFDPVINRGAFTGLFS